MENLRPMELLKVFFNQLIEANLFEIPCEINTEGFSFLATDQLSQLKALFRMSLNKIQPT